MAIINLIKAAKKALKEGDTCAIKMYIRGGTHSNYIFPSTTNGLVGLSVDALFLQVKESFGSCGNQWLDPNESLGNILLHQAADISDCELAKLLLEKGADLASRDRLKRTALHIACEEKSLEMIKILAEKSPPYIFDFRDAVGNIPLEVASIYHCPEAVQILLSHGNSVFGKGDRQVLMSALDNKRGYEYTIPIMSLLLDAGANIDAPDEYGRIPLVTALQREALIVENSTAGQNNLYTDICMFLIDRGCNVNIPWWNGETALHVATKINHEILVRKLLISGSDIDRRDSSGFTPLYYACRNGNKRIVDLLIICGANLRDEWETYFEEWRWMKKLNEKNNQLLNYVISKSKQCLSLENLCNVIIRRNIRNIGKDYTELGLPPLLVKCLQLLEICNVIYGHMHKTGVYKFATDKLFVIMIKCLRYKM